MGNSDLTTDDVRIEVERWIDEHWDPALTVRQWWQLLADAGLSNSMLPAPLGRGYTRSQAGAASAALVRKGVVGPPGGLGLLLAAPTIVAHGTPEQIDRFVPRILNGTDGWCQLFSEPGAGSDLASLQARAERDGDEWIINGQKVWTSMGHYADWGILIARTDPAQPKHLGISYFLFPMRQAGVDVRPLKEMTGRAVFNEVFIDDARVHDDCLLGGLGNGWTVANTTLGYERAGVGGGGSTFAPCTPGSVAGDLDKSVGEFVGRKGEMSFGGVGHGTMHRLIELARSKGLDRDPVVRQRLADLYSRIHVMEWGVARAKAGRSHGGEGSLHKIGMTAALHRARDLACDLLGPDAAIIGPDSASGGRLQELTLFSPAPSIYGGTDEVQRNIIGERVLGLPKEPGPAKDTPFNELLVSRSR